MLAKLLALTVLLCSTSFAMAEQTDPIRLRVDLVDAPRHLVHVTEQIPVHAGMNSFSYPQWIPGQELPGGPIDNLTGLYFRAGGADGEILRWRRDLSDLCQFHVQVPERVSMVTATFDVLEVPSRANTTSTNFMSSHVAMLEPSDVVLYTAGVLTDAVKAAKTSTQPITLTAVRDDETKSFVIPYHDGLRFSVLQRNTNPDLLTTAILRAK